MMMEQPVYGVMVHRQLQLEKENYLARTLISLSGISMTNNLARNIEQLHAELLDYDKRPFNLALYYQPTES